MIWRKKELSGESGKGCWVGPALSGGGLSRSEGGVECTECSLYFIAGYGCALVVSLHVLYCWFVVP